VDAVVVATGFRPSITDPFASWNVDNLGTVALVDAANKAGVRRFVLVSSLLVNGAAVGQFLNPAYIILNLIGLTLIAKLQAEKYIRQSGIDYTIIRPGGLKNDGPSGNTVLKPEDTLFAGSVSRDTVAQVAVDSLLYPEASFKVVELIAEPDAPEKSVQDALAAIPA
jgi:nucleoside-diphosphate-sugar epimerase